ncbi:hypothetical protein J2X20_005299 [Pelomonas saccharophila]|uniref:Glycosyl hydrolase n=1 Tax=Roseateles saccharophilus TaxID=304 RepID=A0ABU1YWK2_ROSSA|nr:glycoside hydrolase family 88 protein [Roseateles saccharophilus]MDR7272616.1 hypothetical protein [Roseateles saccharophilus]
MIRRELLLAALALPMPGHAASPGNIARQLAESYPATASPGYVGALIGAAQRRLGLKPNRPAPPATLPDEWPQRAGYAAFAEAARDDGDEAARLLALQALRASIVDTPQGPRVAGLRAWTDDLFMPTLLFDRALPLLPAAERLRAAEALNASLLALAERLQRADGLFNHAVGSPVAWGRGNGFAALALTQALTGPLPDSPALLARLQVHLQAVLPLQRDDGLWRQVLDHAGAAPELTVTAMNLAALVTARRQGWLPASSLDDAIGRAWTGVQSRFDADGGLRDVCAGTPAGPTLDFYLQRPMVNGRDERAAAMVLLAALSVA